MILSNTKRQASVPNLKKVEIKKLLETSKNFPNEVRVKIENLYNVGFREALVGEVSLGQCLFDQGTLQIDSDDHLISKKKFPLGLILRQFFEISINDSETQTKSLKVLSPGDYFGVFEALDEHSECAELTKPKWNIFCGSTKNIVLSSKYKIIEGMYKKINPNSSGKHANIYEIYNVRGNDIEGSGDKGVFIILSFENFLGNSDDLSCFYQNLFKDAWKSTQYFRNSPAILYNLKHQLNVSQKVSKYVEIIIENIIHAGNCQRPVLVRACEQAEKGIEDYLYKSKKSYSKIKDPHFNFPAIFVSRMLNTNGHSVGYISIFSTDSPIYLEVPRELKLEVFEEVAEYFRSQKEKWDKCEGIDTMGIGEKFLVNFYKSSSQSKQEVFEKTNLYSTYDLKNKDDFPSFYCSEANVVKPQFNYNEEHLRYLIEIKLVENIKR